MFACLHAPGNLPLLLECAQAFSPRVEETSPDTVVLDLDGLDHLFGTPRQIAGELARRNGVGASIAIAANPDAAVHAARGIRGVTVIDPGKEAAALGPLPLNLLSGSPEIAETLDQWGIRTFGELAALPDLGVAARLGTEGVHLQKLARGDGDRPLRPAQDPPRFEEELELEHPVELLEPLSFLLARLLNELCARLESRALATNRLRLLLKLENETEHSLTLNLPVPMRDAKAFGKLLQLNLSAQPPRAPIIAIRLAAEPVKPRFEQHGLFLPSTPEPEKMELTLARIAHFVGERNIGTPTPIDSHRPDSFQLKRSVHTSVDTAGRSAWQECLRHGVAPLPAVQACSSSTKRLAPRSHLRSPISRRGRRVRRTLAYIGRLVDLGTLEPRRMGCRAQRWRTVSHASRFANKPLVPGGQL